jgi:hypothetical protein
MGGWYGAGMDRALEKLMRRYGGDVSRLLDICRQVPVPVYAATVPVYAATVPVYAATVPVYAAWLRLAAAAAWRGVRVRAVECVRAAWSWSRPTRLQAHTHTHD